MLRDFMTSEDKRGGTLAPVAMISFSKLIVSPSAVVSCFLFTSASVTCTPVLYSMSGHSRHCQTLQGMQVSAESGAV